MESPETPADAYEFDGRRLDLRRGVLFAGDGTEIPLRPKSFALLRLLVENAGRLLDRDTIMAAVWPDVIVSDESIAQCVRDIRRALGDDRQQLLRTVPKRGYLFAVEVTTERTCAERDAQSAAADRPEGPQAADPAESDRLPVKRQGKTGIANYRSVSGRLIIALLAMAAVIFLFWVYQAPEEKHAAQGRPGIAVLPFVNLSGDPAQDRWADGLTEDIITDLTRFRDLDVIARNSTAVYGSKPVAVREVGLALGVPFVLEGSLQRTDEKLRVTAQLIDARTGSHVWASRWDRRVEDIFAVQTEISQRVANAIGGVPGAIAVADRIAARRKQPSNLDIYDQFLLATDRKHGLSLDDAETTIDRLVQLTKTDPSFARAWSALAHAYHVAGDWSENPEELRELASQAAQKAVSLDPADAEAHMTLGMAKVFTGDLQAAEAEFNLALDLNPSSAEILSWYAGNASSFNKPKEGAAAAERAMRLNPTVPVWAVTVLKYAFFMDDRHEEALSLLALKPEELRYDQDRVEEACSLAALGRKDEAKRVVEKAVARFPWLSIERFVSRPDFIEHERSRYITLMRKAGFRSCATAQELQYIETPIMLPECSHAHVEARG